MRYIDTGTKAETLELKNEPLKEVVTFLKMKCT